MSGSIFLEYGGAHTFVSDPFLEYGGAHTFVSDPFWSMAVPMHS